MVARLLQARVQCPGRRGRCRETQALQARKKGRAMTRVPKSVHALSTPIRIGDKVPQMIAPSRGVNNRLNKWQVNSPRQDRSNTRVCSRKDNRVFRRVLGKVREGK
jgi:hypothetical protein